MGRYLPTLSPAHPQLWGVLVVLWQAQAVDFATNANQHQEALGNKFKMMAGVNPEPFHGYYWSRSHHRA